MSDKGFILLHRSIMDNPWYMKKPFSKNEAWIDIILLTNHSDSFIDKRGVIVTILRGECGWSILAFSKRWGWSETKVKKFLNDLEKMEQIKVLDVGKITTKIKVLNYDRFQKKEQKVEQKRNRKGTEVEQKRTNKQLNNDNNVNKEKKSLKKYGEYQNIKLTDGQYAKLSDEYGKANLNSMIENMSSWLKSNGKSYKDYAAALRNWFKKREGDNNTQQQSGLTELEKLLGGKS